MITQNRQCSECKGEMILDHVVNKEEKTLFYYACVNPKCKEFGKAYTATGTETESKVKLNK